MYLRLAFAVAAHLEPEILLVDEVLAVGDAAFQKRCLGKMNDVAREGRTVIFVSHNLQAIRRLCSHAVMLEAGRVAAFGETSAVVARYLVAGTTCARRPGTQIDVSALPRTGTGAARFICGVVHAAAASADGKSYSDGPLEFVLEIESDTPREVRSLSVFLTEQYGTKVLNADTLHIDRTVPLQRGRNRVRLRIASSPPLTRNVPGGALARRSGSGPVGQRRLRLRRIGLRNRGGARRPGTAAGTGALVTCEFDVEELP